MDNNIDTQQNLSEKKALLMHIEAVLDRTLKRNEAEAKEEFEALLNALGKVFQYSSDPKLLPKESIGFISSLFEEKLRKGFKVILRREGGDPLNVLGFLMGTVFSMSGLRDLAEALEKIVIERSVLQDFDFAGKGDFIAVEEVMQLFSQGQHTGVLEVEKPHNRIETYFKDGNIAFVSPMKVTRRVIRGEGLKEYREIPVELAKEAEERFAKEGIPIYLTFYEKGFFKDDDFIHFLKNQGSELIYEMIRESSECQYRWRSLETLPDYVKKYNIDLAVMPILLEAHKQMDDWRMIKRIIPDMDAVIEPSPDRFTVLAEAVLDASQIKLLAMINGETTVREMAETAGIPPFEVASMLADFAKMGIIIPPGGPDSLKDQPTTVEESMEMALAALDANEDLDALHSSVAKIFDAMDSGEEKKEGEFSLKFMRAARKKEKRKRK